MDFETIKNNYHKGLWNITALKMAYQRGLITLQQYKEIRDTKPEE